MIRSEKFPGFATWVAIGVLAVVFASSLLWLFSTQKYQVIYQQEATRVLREESRQNFDSNCRAEGLTGQQITDCYAESIATAREAERSEEDLSAQQEMAQWAAASMVISFIGLLVTVAGVILVAANLTETQNALRLSRETLDHARDTSKRALRAYICHDHTELIVGGFPHVCVTIKNTGQTPATIEKIIYRVTAERIRAINSSERYIFTTNAFIGGDNDKFSFLINVDKGGIKLLVGLTPIDEVNFHIVFNITYRDIFDDPHIFEMKLIRHASGPDLSFSMPTEAEGDEDWYDLNWEPRRR